MSNGVKVTFKMTVKPEFAGPFADSFAPNFAETRAFKGCRSVNAYRNQSDPNKMILIEEWDSTEDYQAYIAWRQSTGMFDAIGQALVEPPLMEYWDLIA